MYVFHEEMKSVLCYENSVILGDPVSMGWLDIVLCKQEQTTHLSKIDKRTVMDSVDGFCMYGGGLIFGRSRYTSMCGFVLAFSL